LKGVAVLVGQAVAPAHYAIETMAGDDRSLARQSASAVAAQKEAANAKVLFRLYLSSNLSQTKVLCRSSGNCDQHNQEHETIQVQDVIHNLCRTFIGNLPAE
jgi:hypothetical protein